MQPPPTATSTTGTVKPRVVLSDGASINSSTPVNKTPHKVACTTCAHLYQNLLWRRIPYFVNVGSPFSLSHVHMPHQKKPHALMFCSQKKRLPTSAELPHDAHAAVHKVGRLGAFLLRTQNTKTKHGTSPIARHCCMYQPILRVHLPKMQPGTHLAQ